MFLQPAWKKDLATARGAVADNEASLAKARARGDKKMVKFYTRSLRWSRKWVARAERSAYPHGRACQCERCQLRDQQCR